MEDFARVKGWKGTIKDKRGTCRVCNLPVKPPKLYYFGSPECDKLRHFGGMNPRNLLFCRDNGVCCSCGLDTLKLIDILANKGAVPAFISDHLKFLIKREHEDAPRQAAIEYQLEQWNVPNRGNVRKSLWDMDHVIPVEEYTGDIEYLNELSNLQTLCIPCHKKRSAKQAGGRAKRKKREKKMGPKERQLREMRGNG